MSERYAKVFSLPKNLYQNGAPVVISAGALLKDTATGKMLAQIKFQNIVQNEIKSVKVKLLLSDIAGRPLEETVTYSYLDLFVKPNVSFGEKHPIVLPGADARAYQVIVSEVVFEDNTIWTGEEEPWETCIDAQLLKELSENAELSKNEYETAGTETTGQKAEEKKPKKRKKIILSLIAILAVVFFAGQIFSDDVVGRWTIESDNNRVNYSDNKSYVVFEADGDVRMHFDFSRINKDAIDLKYKWEKGNLLKDYDLKSQYVLYSGDTVVALALLQDDDSLWIVFDNMDFKCSR